MSSPIIQLIVLAAIAIFLILRLRDVLGTREGFEKPVVSRTESERIDKRGKFEVIEGGPDTDITDHVEDPASVEALAKMKSAEHSFAVGEFLNGARGAYEMILMAFESGELDKIRPFLSDEVYESFATVVEQREKDGYQIDANFVGLRELKLVEAEYDDETREGEITIRFIGELTSVVRDKSGEIVEGNPTEVKRQKDIWSFARIMGSENPNWQLVATGG